MYVLEKSTFLIFGQKLGGPLTRGGGGGQPFSGRNSLTDHKKNLLTFPKHLKMPVKWHKKWFTWLSLKLYQKGGNRSSSNSIHMKNFSAVVSPRLQSINAEQVYFQNTPNYSDASFIYVSRHSVSYHTFLVARSLSLAIFDLTSCKLNSYNVCTGWLLRCNTMNIFSFQQIDGSTLKAASFPRWPSIENIEPHKTDYEAFSRKANG